MIIILKKMKNSQKYMQLLKMTKIIKKASPPLLLMHSLTQQLLGQIQHSKSGYGLDALDAAQAALKTAGQTIKVVDNNPPKPKETKTDKKDK